MPCSREFLSYYLTKNPTNKQTEITTFIDTVYFRVPGETDNYRQAVQWIKVGNYFI